MPWRSTTAEIFSRFNNLDEKRRFNAAIARHWLVGGIHLHRMLGSYACGTVLLEAYFSDKPEVGAEYVANRLAGIVSEDTARRRLKQMQDQGTVTCRKRGRTRLYRLRPDLAEAAIAYMRGDSAIGSTQPQIAGKCS